MFFTVGSLFFAFPVNVDCMVIPAIVPLSLLVLISFGLFVIFTVSLPYLSYDSQAKRYFFKNPKMRVVRIGKIYSVLLILYIISLTYSKPFFILDCPSEISKFRSLIFPYMGLGVGPGMFFLGRRVRCYFPNVCHEGSERK